MRLQVVHRLPNRNDLREFTAFLGGTRQELAYNGEGVYTIAARSEAHGTHVLLVELNGTTAADGQTVLAVCPASGRTVKLETGDTCTCHTPTSHLVAGSQ